MAAEKAIMGLMIICDQRKVNVSTQKQGFL